MKSSFLKAVRGEGCLEPPKICRLRGFSLVDLGTGSRQLGAGGSLRRTKLTLRERLLGGVRSASANRKKHVTL